MSSAEKNYATRSLTCNSEQTREELERGDSPERAFCFCFRLARAFFGDSVVTLREIRCAFKSKQAFECIRMRCRKHFKWLLEERNDLKMCHPQFHRIWHELKTGTVNFFSDVYAAGCCKRKSEMGLTFYTIFVARTRNCRCNMNKITIFWSFLSIFLCNLQRIATRTVILFFIPP